MKRYLFIFSAALLLAMGNSRLAMAKDKPRDCEGAYTVSIAGSAAGSGTASVSTASVSLQANITTSSGDKGQLQADNLTVKKNYFSGSGTVLGKAATFKGRLDVPDSVDETAIKGVRLVCTVTTADGQYIRVIGFIPALATAPDSSDDDDDHHRDRGRSAGK